MDDPSRAMVDQWTPSLDCCTKNPVSSLAGSCHDKTTKFKPGLLVTVRFAGGRGAPGIVFKRTLSINAVPLPPALPAPKNSIVWEPAESAKLKVARVM